MNSKKMSSNGRLTLELPFLMILLPVLHTRILRTDDLYIEHYCDACDRLLTHPKAKTACFGHHAEPCRKFRQQLFMIGEFLLGSL